MLVCSHINVGENRAGILLCSEKQLSPSPDKSPFPLVLVNTANGAGHEFIIVHTLSEQGGENSYRSITRCVCLKITGKWQGWNIAGAVQPGAGVSCNLMPVPPCSVHQSRRGRRCAHLSHQTLSKAFKLNLREYLGQSSKVLPAAADSGSP